LDVVFEGHIALAEPSLNYIKQDVRTFENCIVFLSFERIVK